LFERYGLAKMLSARYRHDRKEDAIVGSAILRQIAHAQRIIEGQNFDIRRFLCKFSSLVELQRQIIQDRREECLLGAGAPNFDPVLYKEGLQRFGSEKMAEIERSATLFHLDRIWSDHLAWIQDTRDCIHLVNLGGREPIDEFAKWATEEFFELQTRIDDAVAAEMAAIVRKDGPVDLDLERLKGPSSTWTYLINENPFGSGLEMTKGKNIGFAKLAFANPLFTGMLFLVTLHLNRRARRK